METKTFYEVKKRICTGCNNYINDDDDTCNICIRPINDRGEICPCSLCLIKSMCSQSCEEFRNYCNKGEV